MNSHEQLDIQRGEPRDATTLAEFASRTFVDAYGSTNTPDHVAAYVASAFDTEKVRRELETPGDTFLLGRQDGRIAAYVKLCANQPVDALTDPSPTQLERIYVDAGRQRSGFGALMLRAAIDTAKEMGASAIWLSAWEENERAHAFYRRHGFSVVGRTHFMLGPERQEDLIMARRLEE